MFAMKKLELSYFFLISSCLEPWPFLFFKKEPWPLNSELSCAFVEHPTPTPHARAHHSHRLAENPCSSVRTAPPVPTSPAVPPPTTTAAAGLLPSSPVLVVGDGRGLIACCVGEQKGICFSFGWVPSP